MTFFASKKVMGIIAIIAGILILVLPQIIGWVIGIFLIVNGILLVAGKK
ncbi:DUF3096 domain-containing protein [Chloroflexota bacterium]